MRRQIIAMLALVLASCVEAPPQGPQGLLLTDAERADCLERGGRVGRGGRLPDEICYRPTADAGKACDAKTDCAGMCLVGAEGTGGTCSKESPIFGCFEFLDEQGQRIGICID